MENRAREASCPQGGGKMFREPRNLLIPQSPGQLQTWVRPTRKRLVTDTEVRAVQSPPAAVSEAVWPKAPVFPAPVRIRKDKGFQKQEKKF